MTTRKATTVSGDVAQVDHVGTSVNGNPTYRIRLADGTSYLTGTDAGVGYAATNYRPRRGIPSPVVLTLDGRGRVVGMKRPDGRDA